MVYKKGVGSMDNGWDSKLKRFGVKLFGGQYVKVGNIFVCQCGIKYYLGENVYMGKDFMLYVGIEGIVIFCCCCKNCFYVNVMFNGFVNGNGVVVVVVLVFEKKEVFVLKVKEEMLKVKVFKFEKIILFFGKKINQDDLKMVEGVGLKIEGLLNEGGIYIWEDFVNVFIEKVQVIFDEVGFCYWMYDFVIWVK